MTRGKARQTPAPQTSGLAMVWFRQDLRLADHPPLAAALHRTQRVLPLYVHDTQAPANPAQSDLAPGNWAPGNWAPGGASLWWLHHSLASLARSLQQAGNSLLLRSGDAATIIPALASEAGVTEVHCGLAHEPSLRDLDSKVAEALSRAGIGFHTHRVSTLFDLTAIRTQTGTIYGVYTPFARTCRARPDPEPPLPAPASIPGPDTTPASERLEDWNLLPTRPDWSAGLRQHWQPGEAGAHCRLEAFLADHLEAYGTSRDIPGDDDGTSKLSPHLHWGEISARQVWHAARIAQATSKPPSKPTSKRPNPQPGTRSGFDTFQGELLWHEFAAYLLWHNPAMPTQPLRAAYASLPWRDDPAQLQAWQRGQTGIPIVDAGMRQLWHIGWMHNRVRMITASFLIKHLLISWQQGEAWFWDTLVDGDLATNSASWQWVAGCGTDAQPFFRIFNPLTQSRKFDPEGIYIRRWVPELAKLPDRALHAPWEAAPATLHAAGITLGQTYPKPIVPLEQGRDRALAVFRKEVRGVA